MSRHRSWCFTANNYNETLLHLLSVLPVKYLIYGKEVAPETGTPHLQGYVVFESARTSAAVRRSMPGCHLSVARGTASQNVVYCKKDGEWTERGSCPLDPSDGGRIERSRYVTAWVAATEGRIEEIPEDIRIRHYGTLKRIARDYQPSVRDLESVCGIWIFGKAGCGKSSSVRAQFPEAYPKPMSKWWDGYRLEPTVLLDDVDPDAAQFLRRFLKIWSDRYQFVAEEKGGSRRIRPERFIVTSQYTIEEIYQDQETRDALLRRFRVIEKLDNVDIQI